MNILILANKQKDADGAVLTRISDAFKNRADIVVCDSGSADYSGADIAMAIGGDGTIIRAAKDAAPFGVPVCGINMGKIGFLASAEISEIPVAAEKILSGAYKIEKRMMAEVCISSSRQPPMPALNDIAVGRGAYPKMIEITVADDNDFLDSYMADGVIISTPTGSTAYSLSAGGPVAEPTMEMLLLTPICAFDLQTRSMVLPADRELSLSVGGENVLATLSVDGQEDIPIGAGDKIIIKKSKYYAKLISMGNRSFYSVLRKKLGRKYE